MHHSHVEDLWWGVIIMWSRCTFTFIFMLFLILIYLLEDERLIMWIEDLKDSLSIVDLIFSLNSINETIIFYQGTTFLFDEDNWKQLDALNKAALIMHEIIYDHLYKLGERNSVKVRKMNALLFSNNFNKKQFWELIQDLKLPIYP